MTAAPGELSHSSSDAQGSSWSMAVSARVIVRGRGSRCRGSEAGSEGATWVQPPLCSSLERVSVLPIMMIAGAPSLPSNSPPLLPLSRMSPPTFARQNHSPSLASLWSYTPSSCRDRAADLSQPPSCRFRSPSTAAKAGLSFAQSGGYGEKPRSSVSALIDILCLDKYEEDDYEGITELVESINLQPTTGCAFFSLILPCSPNVQHDSPY